MPRNPYNLNYKPLRIKPYDPFAKTEKRKPVRTSERKHLLEFQKGKCKRCGKSFKQMKVRAILHHKNLNPKDNRITNMILVCPNCHDKIHQRQKKVRVKKTDAFGMTRYTVVKKTTRKKSTKKRKRRKKQSNNIFSIQPIKFKF